MAAQGREQWEFGRWPYMAPLQLGSASVNRLDDDDDADRVRQMDKRVCLLLQIPMPIVDPPEFAFTHHRTTRRPAHHLFLVTLTLNMCQRRMGEN